jgi:hypothetical protein
MTLHLNASESVSQKILSFLESLTKQGESVEIIDDSIYRYEKAGILKGLEGTDQPTAIKVLSLL